MKRLPTVTPRPLIGGSNEARKRHTYSPAAKNLGAGAHVALNAATHMKSHMKRYSGRG